MAGVSTLTPFFEPEDIDAPECGRFVAGYKDEEGTRYGPLVPVDRDVIERLVLTSTPLAPHMDSDGRIQTWPDDFLMSDEICDEMLKRGLLPKVQVDDLVAEVISSDANEPSEGEDGVLEDHRALRDRLQRALTLIDVEIERRVAEL